MRFAIERSWSGEALPRSHHASVAVERVGESLLVRVDAPYFGDAAPPSAVGALDGLAQFEVVELFLAGPDAHYLEIELGPHGHHFVLELRGVRTPVRACLPIEYEARTRAGRFLGSARLPASYLPPLVTRANAYAIHGAADARCYHAHAAVPGARPDFHRLECFVPCAL